MTGGSGVRILCMEDDAALARVYEKSLTRAGYEVKVACNGEQGLELFRAGGFDVVLVDHRMPEKTGLEVIKDLAGEQSLPPIIMVTGAGSEPLAVEAMRLGIADYLVKDSDARFLDRLPLIIERAIERHSVVSENRRAVEALKRAHDELEMRVQERTRDLVSANLRLQEEIAQRRRAEERIQSQHEFLKTVLESLAHPFCVVDASSYEVLLANWAVKARGYKDKTTCYALTHGTDKPCGHANHPCLVDELKRTGRPMTVEHVHTYPDGTSEAVEVHAYPIFDRVGRVVQVIEYCPDITERKKAEDSLRRFEALMRFLIESSPIGIMIGRQGRYSFVNEAWVRMFGYDSGDQIQGCSLEILYSPEYADMFKNNVPDDFSGDWERHLHEVRCIKKNGESFEASIWIRSIRFGGESSVLGFLIDVSEEQSLRAQLLMAQRMEAIGLLAGGIAHDFNNVLFAIMGYAEMSLDLVPRGTRLHEDLQAILEAGKRATDLVSQILIFCRQRKDLEKAPLKIEPMVKETMKFLRAAIPATIAMQHSLIPNLGTVMGSATQIHQVLMNLCTNAAQAMQETGGVLSVTGDHLIVHDHGHKRYADLSPGEYLRLAVADTGHGMTHEIRRRIFEPYFTTKAPGEGTGLGLAVAQAIVKSHGGMVAVESEPGKGSTFEVLLPLIDERPVAQRIPRPGLKRGSEHLLIVDNDKALTHMTAQVLGSLGYRVTGRTSTVEARELFLSMPDRFDLVLTELIMPHMTGKNLAQSILGVRPGMPVIIWTAGTDLMTEEQADTMGLAALVTKPMLKAQLAETIRNALDGRTPCDRVSKVRPLSPHVAGCVAHIHRR